MIKLFGATDTLFSSNGDLIIIPTKAKVKKEDNGEFYLEIETGIKYVDDLTSGRILVAPTPQGEQAFRISNVEKTNHKIKIKALHVFYDSMNYVIKDSAVQSRDCNYALDHFNSNTDVTSPFTTISDITNVASYRCVRTSLYEAVQTVLERWGGHLTRDNFEIGIRANIGTDNGVTVQYKKNLKEINVVDNWDNVCTKILPTGTDGIMLNALDPSASVYMTATVSYSTPFTKAVSFEQSINQEDYATETAYKQALIDDLRVQAQAYLDFYQYPQVNYTMRANVEVLTDIGDTIEVYDERLGINLLTNVISYEYDCILGKYTELEFGNFKKKLSGLMSTITNTVSDMINKESDAQRIYLNAELQAATDRIWGMLDSSYVIYEGNRILIVDQLPKEQAVYVMMIDSGGIGFSSTGINGTFNSAWTIDGTLNMQNINVINLTASLIKGGTLKLGSALNEYGQLEIYDENNNMIAEMNKNGLKMYGFDGSYVLINNTVGFAGYDSNGTKIYWADKDEFHMVKAVVETEITFCDKARFIPITLYDDSNPPEIINDGIGLVPVLEG